MNISIFTGLLGAIALGLLAIFVLGNLTKARHKRQYPPVGKMVDIGGYRLHIMDLRRGSPAVILDAGAGEFSMNWRSIEAALYAETRGETRLVAYDRAGLGWSDLSPRPRTNMQMVTELRDLLQKKGVPAPYILVGASLGGLNMKLYAHLYPDEVAGLVLVDAAHEEQFQTPELKDAMQRMAGMMKVMGGVQKALTFSGLSALFPKMMPGSLPADMPDEVRQMYRAVRTSDNRNTLAALEEIQQVEASHAEIRALGINSLGDIPLIVIRHGKKQAQMMPGLDEIMEETNRRLQAETARLSTRGTLIVAENSGHDIVGEEPEVVIQAILRVLKETKIHD